ncbi:MAG: EcsC family protein, partial [Negativicutes bacterium]|nr:EcsC family protein [Negativicutes bacterium]
MIGDKAARLLAVLYSAAVGGLPGMNNACRLAEEYLSRPGPLSDNVDALIRNTALKCGGVGFVTSLGGLMTLPVALPASLAGTMVLQMRMVLAIAHIG